MSKSNIVLVHLLEKICQAGQREWDSNWPRFQGYHEISETIATRSHGLGSFLLKAYIVGT